MTDTKQEPLVEGESVVIERTVQRDGVTTYIRLSGVTKLAYGAIVLGDYEVNTYPWTIIERRPPKPDWADADAILVEWKDGSIASFPKRDSGSFGFTSPAGWLESLNSALNDIVGIRGLYLRDDS